MNTTTNQQIMIRDLTAAVGYARQADFLTRAEADRQARQGRAVRRRARRGTRTQTRILRALRPLALYAR